MNAGGHRVVGGGRADDDAVRPVASVGAGGTRSSLPSVRPAWARAGRVPDPDLRFAFDPLFTKPAASPDIVVRGRDLSPWGVRTIEPRQRRAGCPPQAGAIRAENRPICASKRSFFLDMRVEFTDEFGDLHFQVRNRPAFPAPGSSNWSDQTLMSKKIIKLASDTPASAETGPAPRQLSEAAPAEMVVSDCGTLVCHLRRAGVAAHRLAPNMPASALAGRDVIMLGASVSGITTAAFAEMARAQGVRSARFLLVPSDVDLPGSPEWAQALLARARRTHYVVRPTLPITSFAAGKVLGPLRDQEFLVGTAGAGREGGLVPREALITVAGSGGIGKTTALLELGAKIAAWDPATEPAPLFMGHEIRRAGRVVFLTAEETLDNLNRKLARLNFTEAERKRLDERLFLLSMHAPEIGPARPLIEFDDKTRAAVLTPAWHWLAAQVAAMPDVALVVIDPVGVFLSCDLNAYNQVYAVLAPLAELANVAECAVCLSAHTNKSRGSGKNGARLETDLLSSVNGSVALPNASRTMIVMHEFTPEREADIARLCNDADFRLDEHRQHYIGAQVVKTNVDGTTRRPMVLERCPEGLRDVAAALAGGRADENAARAAALVDAVRDAAAIGRPFTVTSRETGLAARKDELPPSLRTVGRDALAKLAERLVREGTLVKSRFVNADARAAKVASFLDVPDGPLAALER